MITATRQDIIRRLADAGSVRKFQLELTRGCNFGCVHCRIDNPDPRVHLPLPLIRRILPELRELGVFELNLTGGEIFTHPQAFEVLRTLLGEDFFITLQTNAALIDDDALALLCERRHRINAIAVSLYAAQPEIHDRITRVPGSHQKTLRAMDALVRDGHFVVAAAPQMRDNLGDFEALRSLCAEHQFEFRFGALITPGDQRGTAPLACRIDDASLCRLPAPRDALVRAAHNPPPTPPELAPDQPITAWCPMARSLGYIAADGSVRPCTVVPLDSGNIHNDSLVDIWRRSPELRRIRSFTVRRFRCASCDSFLACRPCPGLAWLEHGDFFAPPREICRITSAFLNKEMNPDEKTLCKT